MELKRVVCPNCGAQIHAKEGRKFMYCEYCGTQIALDDGTQRFEYEFIDRARVKEAENESKRIDERIRDKDMYLQNLSKWTRIRNNIEKQIGKEGYCILKRQSLVGKEYDESICRYGQSCCRF